jgi:hypothetical protein
VAARVRGDAPLILAAHYAAVLRGVARLLLSIKRLVTPLALPVALLLALLPFRVLPLAQHGRGIRHEVHRCVKRDYSGNKQRCVRPRRCDQFDEAVCPFASIIGARLCQCLHTLHCFKARQVVVVANGAQLCTRDDDFFGVVTNGRIKSDSFKAYYKKHASHHPKHCIYHKNHRKHRFRVMSIYAGDELHPIARARPCANGVSFSMLLAAAAGHCRFVASLPPAI